MWKQIVAVSTLLLIPQVTYAQAGGIDHVTGFTPIIYSSPEICIQQLPVWYKKMKKEISHTPGKKLLPSSYTEKTENDAVIDYTRTDDPDHRHSIMVSCKGKMLTGIELTIAQH
jgi:hypothetical protein